MANYSIMSIFDADINVSTTAFSPTSIMTSMVTSNSSNATCVYEESTILYHILMMKKVFKPINYVLGFPGNALAFIVWIRPKMTHSSGVYLAALALADFLFLILNMILYLNVSWHINTLQYPVICESYTVIYLTFQYLAPLLVLAFTIERYISICHPFARERFCTTERAYIVSISLAVGSLSICAIQAYFWTYKDGECTIRPELLESGKFWNIWSMATELLMFLIMPLCVLFFNVLVIKEARRLSAYEPGQISGNHQKASATTIMLLAVSFYLIVTTLPVSVVYVSVTLFNQGAECVSHETDPLWRQYYIYELVREIIEDIGSTHFALNFYIYLITGKQFRKEFFTLCRSVIGKSLPEKVRTEYSTLRGSFGGSFKKTMTVRLSSNGTSISGKDANGSETNV